MTPPPDDALTAVARRPAPTGMNKTLAFLLGFVGALAPAATGYFAYWQARVEAGVDNRRVHDEAAAGYRTLADPLGLATTLLKAHEERIAQLEADVRECQDKTSLAPVPALTSPGLAPLVRLRPLPPTLSEAAAAMAPGR